MRTVHLGDLLVRQGVLSESERDQVLKVQAQAGRPFGVIAEELFGVEPEAVERAWAEQYAHYAPSVDPRSFEVEEDALALINRRQAWQFRLMPLRCHGNQVILCTTQDNLVRALRFAGWRLGQQCQFALTDPRALGEALERYYPLGGMSAELLAG